MTKIENHFRPVDHLVLAALARAHRNEKGRTARNVATQISKLTVAVGRGTVMDAAERLSDAGMIVRPRDPSRKKRVPFTLTAQGEIFVLARAPEFADLFSDAVKMLGNERN